MPLNDDEVVASLTRMLKGGQLDHLPVRRADLDVLLALGASLFARDRAYAERAVKQQLLPWLAAFSSPTSVDHATFRRCLVDLRFLVRDAAGSTYSANFSRVDEVVTESARRIHPGEVLAALIQAREIRKRQRAAMPPSAG